MSTSVRIPKYSLHRATGQARVQWEGRSIYLGVYDSPESRQRYAEFIAGITPKPGVEETSVFAEPIPGRMTIGECVLKYFEHARSYYTKDGKPTSEISVIRALIRPLTTRFADLPVVEFGPKRLKQIQAELIAAGWTRYSINKMTAVVKRCLTWCASEELIPAATALALKTVRGLTKNRTVAKETTPVCPVADEHVDAVLEQGRVSPLVADVIRVMRLTGARPGEILGLTASQLDRTDPSCWVYRPGSHKTEHRNKSRVVLVGSQAQAILLPRILQAAGSRLFPMTRTALRRSIHRACARVGIPSWHPNQIRHSFATEVRAKYGLEAAQILLGHTRADVTQVYAERDLGKAVEVARKIG